MGASIQFPRETNGSRTGYVQEHRPRNRASQTIGAEHSACNPRGSPRPSALYFQNNPIAWTIEDYRESLHDSSMKVAVRGRMLRYRNLGITPAMDLGCAWISTNRCEKGSVKMHDVRSADVRERRPGRDQANEPWIGRDRRPLPKSDTGSDAAWKRIYRPSSTFFLAFSNSSSTSGVWALKTNPMITSRRMTTPPTTNEKSTLFAKAVMISPIYCGNAMM